MALLRGAVIEYPALFDFESYARPYLIVSGDSHPFHGEEYVGLAITTTELAAAIPIDDEAWIQGSLPKPSYITPWQPTLLKHDDINDAFGQLRPDVTDRAVDRLTAVLEQSSATTA